VSRITFVVGGCRSGKSSYAQRQAEWTAEANRIFIATCRPYDDEMRERIRRHQDSRGSGWKTVETHIDLPSAMAESSRIGRVVLVDCLTLWMSNILLDSAQADAVDWHIAELIARLGDVACPTILVSNEVGMGIVPENALARRFRDLVGILNQRVAARADTVVFMAAGIPMILKEPPTP